MKTLFDKVSIKVSKMATRAYSTSFSMGIRLLKPSLHDPIYAIYGFVRYADEIVDTFHEFDQKTLLSEFRKETFVAIERGISVNPILNSFQWVVNEYDIDHALIVTFLDSMEMDLYQTNHDEKSLKKYILGSAEVVGLMCLKVFCDGDQQEYEKLTSPAMALGSAFQKVNFLRDLKADNLDLGRTYFPDLDLQNITEEQKMKIIEDIEDEFHQAFEGIKQLPKSARLGVHVAYIYYLSLLRKIKRTHSSVIREKRIRVPNAEKYRIAFSTAVKYAFNLF